MPIYQKLLGYLPQSLGEPYLKSTVGVDTPIAHRLMIFLREELTRSYVNYNAVNDIVCRVFNEGLPSSTLDKFTYRDGSSLLKPPQRKSIMKTNAELVEYYKSRLEKVKAAWLTGEKEGSFGWERGQEYVKHAEGELVAVMNGRSW